MINDTENIQANELMRAGLVAFGKGDHQQAHDLWRKAAALRPHNEQVWLALLSVVNNEEDRRVCLENILYINPQNVQAQKQLRSYLSRHSSDAPLLVPAPIRASSFSIRRVIRSTISLLLTTFLLLGLFILGIAAGMVLNVL